MPSTGVDGAGSGGLHVGHPIDIAIQVGIVSGREVSQSGERGSLAPLDSAHLFHRFREMVRAQPDQVVSATS